MLYSKTYKRHHVWTFPGKRKRERKQLRNRRPRRGGRGRRGRGSWRRRRWIGLWSVEPGEHFSDKSFLGKSRAWVPVKTFPKNVHLQPLHYTVQSSGVWVMVKVYFPTGPIVYLRNAQKNIKENAQISEKCKKDIKENAQISNISKNINCCILSISIPLQWWFLWRRGQITSEPLSIICSAEGKRPQEKCQNIECFFSC